MWKSNRTVILGLSAEGTRIREPMKTFFSSASTNFDNCSLGPLRYKARVCPSLYIFKAILVDMEERVVNSLLKSPIRHLFDDNLLLTDVSGSGNNWATGNLHYGNLHHDQLRYVIRKAVEKCDMLQCFFMIHSMGGVFPSTNDDVITSPYNTVLALHELSQYSDCVIPIDNISISNIIAKMTNSKKSNAVYNISKVMKPFDQMNSLIANLLLNLTSSDRFEGTMNVDLSELTTNLVPYSGLHYLIPSQSPLDIITKTSIPRKIDQMFTDVYSSDHQLISVDPYHHRYLATLLLLRGPISSSDIRRNVDRLQSKLNFVPWNREGWKIGHCRIPSLNQKYNLLALSNNTAIHKYFESLLNHFAKLYRRKAHLHHYTNVPGFEIEFFEQATNSLTELKARYMEFENESVPRTLPQLRIMD